MLPTVQRRNSLRRGSIFEGLNLFGRFSSEEDSFSARNDVQKRTADSNIQSSASTEASRSASFQQPQEGTADFDKKEESWIEGSLSIHEIHEDASAVNMPRKGLVSISTAFTAVFIVFVAILGASLMIISAKYSAESNELSAAGTNVVQEIFLSLVESTNSRLINASNYSINTLAELIAEQVNERVVAAVSSYTGKCKFSVTQMADMAANGELDVLDIDAAFHRLWRLNQEFTEVASLIVSGAEHGNWIVVMRGLRQEARITLLIRNTSGTACRACLPAATTDSYLYTVDDPADPMNWTYTGAHFDTEPRARPWYLTGLAGQGAGRWTAPYVFDDEGNVGITAARAARAGARAGGGAGPILGVVGSDLTLDAMSAFLRGLTAELGLVVGGAAEGIEVVVVHESGALLATSTGDPLSAGGRMLNWSDAIAPPAVRAGLAAADAHWGGDWARPFAPPAAGAPPEGFRRYPHPALCIVSVPYRDDWGLRALLLTVLPVAGYRREIDGAMAAALGQVGEELAIATGHTAGVRGRVGATVVRNWALQLGLSVGILAAGCAAVFGFAVQIRNRLRALAEEMGRVATLDFADRRQYGACYVDEVVAIGRSFALMDVSLLSFSRYVPENVVRLLASRGTVARLGVSPRDVTVMFSDIVGFTTLAEQQPPEVLIAILAEYLEAMSACIEASGGTVGKFIGDAIMAFWNSPDRVADHACVACAAALAQQARLAELRAGWAALGYPPIAMRLGLSTGVVLHGNVGSHRRMEWTLIGDEVNLASRLEAMCKQYGVAVLISGSLHALVRHRFLARPIDRVVAVGKQRAVDIFELVSELDGATPEDRRRCSDFEAVVEAYRARDFAGALALAESFAGTFPGDVAARKYAERCRCFMECPPGEDWDGTFVLTSK